MARRRRWPVVMAAVIVAVTSLVAMVWSFQRSFIYFPDSSDPGSASRLGAGASDVTLSTEDGLTLSAWRIDPAEPNGAAVLYFPGNGGNRAGRAGVGRAIAERGFTVVLVDYRGFGGNPGSPSEEGLIRDAGAAAAYLREAGFAPEQTIYVGESIGTGVAMGLAEIEPAAGVLLRSPFTSLVDSASHRVGFPVGAILRDRFETISRISEVTSPITVLAGEADAIVPASQSVEVAEAAPNLHELITLPDVGHNDGVWFGSYVAERVVSLAEAAGIS